MSSFDVAAVVIAVAALSGYINHRLLRLPPTTGTLLVVLVASLGIVAIEQIAPAANVRPVIERFLAEIDFNQVLMHGFLCFLLFAGGLHVDLDGLLNERYPIIVLSTVGVLLSVAVVGLLMWYTLDLIGLHLDLMVCLAFGALISPTDPIAVMGLLKELHAPPGLEAQIAGESLFNDGVGVVIFLALVSLAGLSGAATSDVPSVSGFAVVLFAVREIAGGIGLGLCLGYLAYRALLTLDDRSLELLITLALVMFLYAASFWIHVSGPIAVVVAGLLMGNRGRRFAMTERTREHVDAFWGMIDEILNAVLFLLLGLEVFAVTHRSAVLVPALLAVPICLLGRYVSVGIPFSVMRVRSPLRGGLVPVLTWSGLRGGISVAMALSLPEFSGKAILLASTYAVVVFGVLVQGTTVRRVLVHYGVGTPAPEDLAASTSRLT